MQSRIGRGYAAVAVITLAVALLAASMATPAISATEDFSIFNSGWNGTSKLAVMVYETGKLVPTFRVEATGTDITVTQTALSDISQDPKTGAIIMIGPAKEFTEAEGVMVGDFVREGGRLVLADDFGTGNSLLSSIGAGSRFSGDLVIDLAFEKQPEFSVVFDMRPDPLTADVRTVLLNYPSSIVIDASTTSAMMYSSVASWRDSNGNGLQDPGEPKGPFPLMARERLGLGTIVLLSDPSALINGMREHMDNAVLAANLMGEACADRSEVLFDESHREFFDPISATIELTGDISATGKALIAVAAFGLLLWVATDTVDNALAWMVRRARVCLVLAILTLKRPFSRTRPASGKKSLTLEETVDMISKDRPDMRLGLVRYMLRERDRHAKAREGEKA